MEIRVVIISDNGQTSVTEFKTFSEAGDFCYSKETSPTILTRDEAKEQGIDVDKVEAEAEQIDTPRGFIHTLKKLAGNI